MSTPPKRRYRLLIVIIATLLALLLSEGLLRLLNPPALSLNHLAEIFHPDPETGFRYIPNARSWHQRYEYNNPVQVNARGWLGPDYPDPAPDGVTRIVLLGDSFIAGLEAPPEKDVPTQLQKLLDDAGSQTQVLNYGLYGSNPLTQGVLLQKDILPRQPDVVLVLYFDNDVPDVRRGMVYRDVYKHHVLVYENEEQRTFVMRTLDSVLDAFWYRAVRASYLARLVWVNMRSTFRNALPVSPLTNLASTRLPIHHNQPEAEALIVDAYQEMAKSCQQAGCHFAVFFLADKEVLAGKAQPSYTNIRAQLDQLGIPTVDLLPALQAEGGQALYYRYDGHFNADGDAFLARQFQQYLDEQGWIP